MRSMIRFAARILPFIILISSHNILLAAETGKMAGSVSEQTTGEPLIGASVYIEVIWADGNPEQLLSPFGAATDEYGQYFILNVPPGEYNVKCSYMGYRGEEVTRVRVAIDRTTEINFAMTPEVFEGEAVVVTAYKPNEVERDLTATKQTYIISEVQQIAGINDLSDILDLQADVVDNHFRGGREGESQYLLGGASINNPLDNSRAFNPMVIALKEVEVLTSGFSAEYGNAQSGVINMIPREGGEKWKTRFEFSSDLTNDQMWGGNPYSQENMPFYTLLSNPEEWINPYLSDGNTKYPMGSWSKFIPPENHYDNITDPELRAQIMRQDSIRGGQMAMLNWLQMARLVELQDNAMPAHRFDLTAGGPVNKYIRMFFAASQKSTKPVVPVTHDNLTRQIMTNMTIQTTPADKFTLYYHYNYGFSNSVSGPTNWFDTVIHNSKTISTDQLLGINYNRTFSGAAYMDLAIRVLNTFEEERPEFLDPDRFISNAFNGNSTNNTYAGRYDNTPSGHRINNLSSNRGTEKTKTYAFEGGYGQQVNMNNLFKAGVNFQYYSIAVDLEHRILSPGEYGYTRYDVNPYEGALYIQDKMEFEGFIANLGLRYDFYNFNYDYYSNMFTPLYNPKYPEEGEARDPDYALKESTKPFGKLQPRLGISFPISVNTVFHLNYGTFIQRPGFDYILRSEFTSRGNINEIGNARLKPEKTSAWDIGIVHALPMGFRLDVSAYYKDVNDLTEQAVFVNAGNEQYVNYINRDYADIKGFNINLEKTTGLVNFYLRYNYQTAKGKASEPGGALVTIYETPLDDGTTIDLPDPRDILMDYDRTHRLVVNARLNTPDNFGPDFLGAGLFSDMSFSFTYKYQSGRPYTDDEQLLGLVLNKRMPGISELKMRIQKSFRTGNFDWTMYLEGFNLLNTKEWSRQIFTDRDMLKRWKRGDRDELVWYDPAFEEDPNESRAIYQYNDAYSIYDNEPRYFRLGIRLQM